MTKLDNFNDYLVKIDNPVHREQLTEVLQWVIDEFPTLETKIAWNQPMYTDHGTFIIGFSIAKPHFAVAPEGVVIEKFAAKIEAAGYNMGKKFMRIKWDQPVNYDLLREIIPYNIDEKKDCTTFWRK